MMRRTTPLLFCIILAAGIFCGCTPKEGITEEGVNYDLEGKIIIDGSSTVYPITLAVVEEFMYTAPRTRPSIGLSGTGGGFTKFCLQETDISNASRPIKEIEIEECAENGVEFIEFVVAMDGLTIMVNPENTWLESLSAEDIAALFGTSSEIVTWSDLDPSYPDEEVKFFIPDPDSGTRDYLTEIVEDANGDEDLRQDENTSFSSDDNVLLDGVANNTYAIGFFGFAYYTNSADRIRAVPIINEDGEAVLPTNETVQDGSYNPLSRPLFIYVNTESLSEKAQVKAFIEFYFSDAGGPLVVAEVGYSMPVEGTYEANLALLEEALQ